MNINLNPEDELKISKDIILNEIKTLLDCTDLLQKTKNPSLYNLLSEIKNNKKQYIKTLIEKAKQANILFTQDELNIINKAIEINTASKPQNIFKPLY